MFAGTCLDNNIRNPLPGMSHAVSKSRVACGAESAATGPWSGLPGGGGGGLSTSNMLSTSPTLMSSISRSSSGSSCSPGWPLSSLHPWLGLLSLCRGATTSGGLCTATRTAWFPELDWYPNKDWHIIDTQLWSMALHGVHTLPNQGNPKQYTFKPKNPRRPQAGMDNQFKNCFDHNRGGCHCPSCSFPHMCGRCRSPSHTTSNWPQGQGQYQSSQATIQQNHNPFSRTTLRATNTNQSQPAQRATPAPSRRW